MRIPKLFKKNNAPARKFKVPSSWKEVTNKEFAAYQSIPDAANDLTAVLGVFTGIDKKEWDLMPADQVGIAAGTLAFMLDELPEELDITKVSKEMETIIWEDKNDVWKRKALTAILGKYEKTLPKEIWINEKPIKLPDNLMNPAYAARKDIENAIKTYQGSNITELIPGILCCLLHEAYTGGPYDREKAMSLLPYMEEMPAIYGFPIGFFFLAKLQLKVQSGLIV